MGRPFLFSSVSKWGVAIWLGLVLTGGLAQAQAPCPRFAAQASPSSTITLCPGRTTILDARPLPSLGFVPGDPGPYGNVFAITLQPNGSVLIGGGYSDYSYQHRGGITRLYDDGGMDASFAPVGTGLDTDNAASQILAQVLQPDGKVLVGGTFRNYSGVARRGVARLNADGSLDTSFAPIGTGLNGPVTAIALQPNGKMLVGGEFTSYNGTGRRYIARLNADGSLDTSFAPSGTGFDRFVNAMALQPDGKVVVGGQFASYDGAAAAAVIRLNADGTRDASFTGAVMGLLSTVRVVLLQTDGKVLVTGNYGLRRLNADGTLDASFAAAVGNAPYALALQPDGKLVVGGGQLPLSTGSAYVARLNADGSQDATFHTTGTGLNNYVYGVAVQPDGRVLVAGTFTRYDNIVRNKVARLNIDGSLDDAVTLTNVTYQWSPGGSTSPALLVTQPGIYSVAISSGGCTAVSAPVLVQAPPAVPVTVMPTGPTTLPTGGSVGLTATAGGLAGASYRWSPGGATTASITVTQAGSYVATVTNPATGCQYSSAPVVVTVGTLAARSGLAGAAFEVFPNPARASATVQLGGVPGTTQAVLTLLDGLGRTVRTQQMRLTGAGGTANVLLTGLAPGLYQIRVQAGGQQGSHSLAVE